MPFYKTVRIMGLKDAILSYLIFPFWLIWHYAYFLPKVRRAVVKEYCGGNPSLFREEMLEQYARERLYGYGADEFEDFRISEGYASSKT